MKILAFETSCDDTSVAILDNDKVLSISTRTQLEHNITWWVVPEVAARSHANAIFPCLDDVFDQTWLTLDDIDYIACTQKPWLQPSLLTWLTVARTIANFKNKPIILIDHIESHIFANFLERNESDIIFPSVVLTISWWHTELYFWRDIYSLEILWQTQDDAVGEAYDKVAKMLGMWFPGGAKIAKLAQDFRNNVNISLEEKNLYRKFFPRAFLDKNSLNFSFSWLKSAVKRYIDSNYPKNNLDFSRIAFAFEEAVFDVLIYKILLASEQKKVKSIVLAGWVSSNSYLKEKLKNECDKRGLNFIYPVKNIYSQDNAAMIGVRAFYEIKKNIKY